MVLSSKYKEYLKLNKNLYFFDNRKKYKSNLNKTDWVLLKSDFVKIISSVGIGEVVYLTSRWFLQFHFLNIGIEAYQASIIAQFIAFVLFIIVTNVVVKLTKLYK